MRIKMNGKRGRDFQVLDDSGRDITRDLAIRSVDISMDYDHPAPRVVMDCIVDRIDLDAIEDLVIREAVEQVPVEKDDDDGPV